MNMSHERRCPQSQRRLEFPGVGGTGGPEAAGDRCCTMNCTLTLEQQMLLANEQYHRPK